MILGLVLEAVDAGARQDKACEIAGVDARSLQRWRGQGIGDDLRAGPKTAPSNKLTTKEQQLILDVANLPEHRDLTPKQIVPKLADDGRYIASESSFYRTLRAADQMHHRESSKPVAHHRPRELVATAPNQVWTWDITYLLSLVKGKFFYLHLVLDIWSRKIVGWAVHPEETGEHGARLISEACAREGVQENQLTLHQDNGAPMKCGTFLALLQWLGVAASFSRPGVSDDNPFVEALFRTFKYRPEYPDGPFASLEAARIFVDQFVHWYNTEHRHSGIRFVTPAEKHIGKDREILAQRSKVYEAARTQHPERWSGTTRDWSPIESVVLNPENGSTKEKTA